MKTNFYQFNQNNSGGSFVTNENITHRVVIEAENVEEAVEKAEELGCYWNGCDDGTDCNCCGDRWYQDPDRVDLKKLNKDGYPVHIWDNSKEEWNKRYGKYLMKEEPSWQELAHWKKKFWFHGKIAFKSVEDYIQFLSNEHGWCSPEAMIYYKDGTKLEIFKEDGM